MTVTNPPSTQLISVSWIDIDSIFPHPLNPRPWSERHQARVYDDKVEELQALIATHGFDTRQALIVRPMFGESSDVIRGYMIIVGHHRWAGARANGMTQVPCFIDTQMTDATAAMAVVSNQGKQVETWFKAQHAYRCCNEGYGRGQSMTQEEYSAGSGVDQRTVSTWIQAYRVKLATNASESNLTVRAAREIATLDEQDWKWFTDAYIKRGWGIKARGEAIKAIKAIDIPAYFANWLDPTRWKREAAIEAAEVPVPQAVANLKRWISVADRELAALPAERPVWRIVNNQPELDKLNLQQEFIAQLETLASPNETKIKQIASQVLDAVKPIDAAYKQWQDDQRSAESRRLAQEAAAQARLEMEVEFAPKGHLVSAGSHHTDCTSVVFGTPQFDAVFVQCVTQPDEQRQILDVLPLRLKQQGVVICVCDPASLWEWQQALRSKQFCVLDILIWLRTSSDISDRFVSGYQSVLIATPGDKQSAYLNLEELSRYFPSEEPYTDVMDCVADRDALTEYLLAAYVPVGGQILELFNPETSAARAAKRMGYKAEWVVSDSESLTRAEAQIEATPYSWEILR